MIFGKDVEMAMVKFKVLSQHLPGKSEGNYQKSNFPDTWSVG
jgi:hypothetical protein